MLGVHVLRPKVGLSRTEQLARRLTALSVYLARSAQEAAEPSGSCPGQTDDRAATARSDESRPDTPQLDVETLFREWHPRVYAYVRYRVADLQEAEDLTSEIMERALTHLDTYDVRKGAFSTWLFRIAHNTHVNYAKKQQRQGYYQVDLGEGFEDLATDEPSPEQAAVRTEEVARLLACVRTLSARKQEILSMRFAGRLTNREIANVLQMNERTVSVVILRALRALRRKLGEPPGNAPSQAIQGAHRSASQGIGSR